MEEEITPIKKDKSETAHDVKEPVQEEQITLAAKDKTESVPKTDEGESKKTDMDKVMVEVLTDESAANLNTGKSLDIKWKITGKIYHILTPRFPCVYIF